MAQRREENNKVSQYRKPINLNIGILIFFAVFIYVAVFVIISLQTERIVPYEVREGSLAINYTYRALALRKEQVVTAEKNGYINYMAREGERVALGNTVYILDESGELKDYLQSTNVDDSTLSDDELTELRSEIVDFVYDFDETDFSDVYDFKYTLKGTVMRLANTHLTENIDAINNGSLNGAVNYCNAVNTGIVTYYTDGYESVTPQDITLELFDETKYQKDQLIDNDAVYKISEDENWSLILPIEESMAQDFLDEEYIKVRFLKNQDESWGQVFILNGADGNTYMQLLFNNSMITFAKDRFVDIELLLHEETGLKIPNTSIANREFFLIPQEYISVVGDDSDIGVIMREAYKEDGTITTDYTEVELYNYDEESKEYYIDSSMLNIGENLLRENSQEKFTVSRKGSLIGVYYMNKGYADFRQIQILYQNDEYAIVKSNTQYGLNVYDYVVLNAESVSDEQFIYD